MTGEQVSSLITKDKHDKNTISKLMQISEEEIQPKMKIRRT